MNNIDIISKIDHSVLSTTLTFKELKEEIDFALEAGCACLAISPNYIKESAQYIKEKNGKIFLSSAIGFSRGDTTTKTKIFEAVESIENGATEIDAMINLCQVKSGNWEYIENEFRELRKVCKDISLKIIVETSELTAEEKIKICQLITLTKIDYIKTSTGFSSSGATFADIELFKKHIGKNVKIKASGGVKTREDAVKFIEMGVDRIGTKFSREFII